jgi:hypothetical protein
VAAEEDRREGGDGGEEGGEPSGDERVEERGDQERTGEGEHRMRTGLSPDLLLHSLELIIFSGPISHRSDAFGLNESLVTGTDISDASSSDKSLITCY